MGEYEQPVVGMRSCVDYAEMQDAYEWNAREWFLVRKAEMQLSNSNILVPMVKMGVEAREQVVNNNSLQDKPVTCSDHPLALYADDFTRYFDLIAERKSVIFHLRELAKASVMAKYLIESGMTLEASWFLLGMDREVACSLEVPQLWNERIHAEVNIEDCSIVRPINSNGHGVYGGVQFGLDKFNLSAAAARHTGALQLQARPGLLSTRPGAGLVAQTNLGQMSTVASAFRGAGMQTRLASLSLASGGVAPPASGIQAGLQRPQLGFTSSRTRISATNAYPASPMQPPQLTPLSIDRPAGILDARLPQLSGLSRFNMAVSIARQAALPPLASADLMAAASGSQLTSPGGPSPPIRLGAALTAATLPASRQIVPLGRDLPPGVVPSRLMGPPAAAGVSLTGMSGVARVQNIHSALSMGVGMAPEVALAATTLRPPTLHGLISPLSAGGYPQPLVSAAGIPPRLQGVDLRLDSFDLSELKRVPLEAQSGSWSCDVKSLDECVEVGSAFFACLDGSPTHFKDDDRALLKSVFNPALTDRRKEGDLFIPPDPSHSQVQKLRDLVKQEESVREKRKEVFLSIDFLMGNPGLYFPHSWTPTFEITYGQKCIPAREGQSEGALHPRPEFKDKSMVLDCVLKTSVPIFDKCTEEGLRFRIYRVGGLEVRSTQEPDGEQIVGAVFSIRSRAAQTGLEAVGDREKISAVMECVENSFEVGIDQSALACRYFLVLETEEGNKIVTERLGDGQLAWIENPESLDDRKSLAKVIRRDIANTGITVAELKEYRAKLALGVPPSSKLYAQAMLVRTAGPKHIARAANIQEFPFWMPSRNKKSISKLGLEGADGAVVSGALSDDGPSCFDLPTLPGRAPRSAFQVRAF